MERFIFLGASNLAMGLPHVLAGAQHLCRGPLDVVTMCGHGRSFGNWSRVLVRELPGILQCEGWPMLTDSAERCESVRALITDVGNDLLYGHPPQMILGWLEECLHRLRDLHAEMIATQLPLGRIRRITAGGYYLARTLLFPQSRVSFRQLQDRVTELADGWAALCREWQIALMEPPREWYGVDPIHLRRHRRGEAWSAIFSQWNGVGEDSVPRNVPGTCRRLVRDLQPAHRRWFGREQRCDQPGFVDDRLTVWCY